MEIFIETTAQNYIREKAFDNSITLILQERPGGV